MLASALANKKCFSVAGIFFLAIVIIGCSSYSNVEEGHDLLEDIIEVVTESISNL